MNPRGYIHETGSISSQLVAEMLEADLVIADLSELSGSGFYELGVRHAASLPTVFIGDLDYVLPFDAHDFPVVRYHWDTLPKTAGDQATIETLVQAIREALEAPARGPGAPTVPKKATPKERRDELAERIVETAEVIRLLRVNSAGEAVSDLIAIADELRTINDVQTPSALKEAAEKTLKVLFQIMGQLASVRGSRMAISGTIALVVGGAGWPAVTAFGLGLAYWEGKDAFLKAMDRLGKKRT